MISGFGVTTVLQQFNITEYFSKLMQIFHLKKVTKERHSLTLLLQVDTENRTCLPNHSYFIHNIFFRFGIWHRLILRLSTVFFTVTRLIWLKSELMTKGVELQR